MFSCIWFIFFFFSVHTSWQGSEEKPLVWKVQAQFFVTPMKRPVILSGHLSTCGITKQQEPAKNPSVQIIKVHCMSLQFYITEGWNAIISTVIPGFQPKKKKGKKQKQWHNKPKWSVYACANHTTYLMCHNMEWPRQTRLQVMWFTLTQDNTHEDKDSVSTLKNYTDKNIRPAIFKKNKNKNLLRLLWKKMNVIKVSVNPTQRLFVFKSANKANNAKK